MPFRSAGTRFPLQRAVGTGFNQKPYTPDKLKSGIEEIKRYCTGCEKVAFYCWIEVNTDENWIRKVGQVPPFRIEPEKSLDRFIKSHRTFYKKGLISESQGYGIGAYAYYRRIVEEVIDDLLSSIASMVEPEAKDEYLQALEKARQTRVVQNKIELVKDFLPNVLRPDGMNPLSVLHGTLSEGIHQLSEEECLRYAKHIREVLVFLVDQIEAHRESTEKFSRAMKSLLDS